MTAEKRVIDQKLESLEQLRSQARKGGGQQRIDQQHGRGKLTARERLALLMDEGTFEEIDSFVTHRATDFGLADRKFLGDAVVTGHGKFHVGSNKFELKFTDVYAKRNSAWQMVAWQSTRVPD